MMTKQTAFIAVICLTVSLVATLGAQTRAVPATLDDLLSELRGMRSDLARTSNATVRKQMLVARMQVQEQRINTVVRQITEVQNQIASTRPIVAALEAKIKQGITSRPATCRLPHDSNAPGNTQLVERTLG